MTTPVLVYTHRIEKLSNGNLFHLDEETNILKAVTNNVTTTTTKPVPPIVSFNIPVLPPILNQLTLGDCVANAFSYTISSITNNKFQISRLFTYANARCIGDEPLNQDSGTDIPTLAQAIINWGSPMESAYPYNISNFVYLPPLTAFQSSKLFKQFTYIQVGQNIASVKEWMNANKSPVIMGINVYSSFMTQQVATSGIIPMPNKSTETLEGGHCVCVVGYNDTTQQFYCANSWGTTWGAKGYFYLPYAYILDTDLTMELFGITFIY